MVSKQLILSQNSAIITFFNKKTLLEDKLYEYEMLWHDFKFDQYFDWRKFTMLINDFNK